MATWVSCNESAGLAYVDCTKASRQHRENEQVDTAINNPEKRVGRSHSQLPLFSLLRDRYGDPESLLHWTKLSVNCALFQKLRFSKQTWTIISKTEVSLNRAVSSLKRTSRTIPSDWWRCLREVGGSQGPDQSLARKFFIGISHS